MTVKNKKKHLAIIHKGHGPESEISAKTSQAVAKALKNLSYPYTLIEADHNLYHNLKDQKPDVAFLAVHGVYGEDGCVQAICEMLSIPYTGSGVLGSALCMDKLFFKKLLIQNKIATPHFQIVNDQWKPPSSLKNPVVVKASHGGSTLGTYIATNKDSLRASIEQAQKIGSSVFLEDYIPSAKELAVSFLDDQILTPVEIVPQGGFYDYKRKYEKNLSTYHVPPRLDGFTVERLKAIASDVFSLVPVRGYGRIDFLIDKNKTPWCLEVNTLPGLTETSLLPKSAKHDGIDFEQLIQIIIDKAQTDYPARS